jgi:hypothetical protein
MMTFVTLPDDIAQYKKSGGMRGKLTSPKVSTATAGRASNPSAGFKANGWVSFLIGFMP